MRIPTSIVKEIITKVLNASDYRIHVVSLINTEFLQWSLDFFKRVVEAKLTAKDITIDWYKKASSSGHQKAKAAVSAYEKKQKEIAKIKAKIRLMAAPAEAPK